MRSSAVDAMTGGMWSVLEAQLGSPCHFLVQKVSVIGTTSHAHTCMLTHTHTHTHTRTHTDPFTMQNKASCTVHLLIQLHAHACKHTHTTQIRSRCCSWLSVRPKHRFPGHLSSGAADGDMHADGVCQRCSQTTAILLRVVCV